MGVRSSGLSDDRRSEILSATVATIAQRGVESVRLSDIARACGVSVGSLQHHFATRDQLIDAAFYSYTLGVVHQIQSVADVDAAPWDRIRCLIEAYRGVGDFHQRSRLWVEFASAAARDEVQRDRITSIHAEWARPLRVAIDDGVAQGVFQPIADTDEIVESLLATMDGYDLAYAAGILDLGSDGVNVVNRLMVLIGAALGVMTRSGS